MTNRAGYASPKGPTLHMTSATERRMTRDLIRPRGSAALAEPMLEQDDVSGIREVSSLSFKPGYLLSKGQEQMLFRMLRRIDRTESKLTALLDTLPEGARKGQVRGELANLDMIRVLMRNIIVRCNQGLVRKAAFQAKLQLEGMRVRRGMSYEVEDLVGYGQDGLYDTIPLFDPELGFAFSTYALPAIKKSIVRDVIQKEPIVYMTERMMGAAKDMVPFIKEHRERTGEFPSEQEIADGIGVSIETIRRIQRIGSRMYASRMDQEKGTEPFLKVREDEALDSVHQLVEMEMRHTIRRFMDRLEPREQEVLRRRFGFDGDEQSYEEISTALSVSKQVPANIERQALFKIGLYARKERLELL